MASKKALRLADAMNPPLIIRFSTPYESGRNNGYVLDIGPKFFLFAIIDDYQKFNGFQCSRISDVRGLRVPAPYADFYVAALRKQGQVIHRKPEIDLSSLSGLLNSAKALFSLITIHRERLRPDECVIGKVLKLSKSKLLLHTIGPDAVWHENPSEIRLRDVTRVDFGGGYEESLHLVGGDPKQLKKSKRPRKP